MLRYNTFLILLSILLLPTTGFAEEINAGFVQGLWYSARNVFVDTPVRIYVAVRNNSEKDLSGTVVFSDNGARVGTLSVNALPGRIVEAWADWKPLYGNHKIVATFIDTRILNVGTTSERIDVESTLAEDTIFVDYDTDNDGSGNTTDTDDDNDTVSDEDEKKQQSDPLVPNHKKEVLTEAVQTPTNSTSTEEEAPIVPAEQTQRLPQGLERYFADSGRIDSVLKQTTNKIEQTKSAIDEYRTKRSHSSASTGSSIGSSTITNTSQTDDGTQKSGTGIFAMMIDGLSSIVSGAYTLILWLLSHLFANPIVVQVLLLFLIPYVLVKIARRMSRRPDGFT